MRRNKIGLDHKIPFGLFKGFPVHLIVITIVLFLGILFSTVKLVKFLYATDYFKIRDIIFSEESKIELAYLEGHNIFTVDTGDISRYITKSYPVYRNVRIVRIFPDRIFVNLTRREPLAVIKLYRYFYVDKEAVLFNADEQFIEQEDLPIIVGLEKKIVAPKLGTRYNIKELVIALNILRRINLSKVFKEYKFKKIYVENLGNMSFFMSLPLSLNDRGYAQAARGGKELEIRFDAYNVRDKFNILAGLLSQVRNDLGNIKYIDLRFKEPVIKFNEDKSG